MHDGSAYRRPLSALLTNASESSFLPTAKPLFRTPLASDSSRGGETLDQVRARRGTIALSHQIIDLALNGPPGSNRRIAEWESLWLLIEDIFNAGDTTRVPSPDGNTSQGELPPHQPADGWPGRLTAPHGLAPPAITPCTVVHSQRTR